MQRLGILIPWRRYRVLCERMPKTIDPINEEGHFTCDNKDCINGANVCDDVADCKDVQMSRPA